MKKIFKILFILLIVAFVLIQFFQPEKNLGEASSNHIFEVEDVPENIKGMLKTACLDCHSNQTQYKWYHKPAPVSWMISDHIIVGKEELNLSDWGEMDISDKITTLEEMCSELERDKMPLKSYLIMHRDAKFSDEQKAEFCRWSEELALKMLAEI